MKSRFVLAFLGASIGGATLYGQVVTPLAQLIAEAQQNSGDLHAAEHDWQAAQQKGRQAGAWPDPQFTVQEFSVGSPRPGAGLSNSDFAYVGIGASQEIPYPGKRRLKTQAAVASAGVQEAQLTIARAGLVEAIKSNYFRLAYLQATLGLLESSRNVLGQIIDGELARYRSGESDQAEVLKAQLERTKMVREITMHHEEMAQVEADLKALTHRNQESADIIAETIGPRALSYSAQELLEMARQKNPEADMEKRSLDKELAELKSAQRAGKPDFSLGYMYERTGLDFPAYYMLTVGITLPRPGRARAQVAETSESVSAARERLDAVLQRQLAEVQKEYAKAANTAELLTQYNDGLIPQAEAAFRAGLARYESQKQSFDRVLSAFDETLVLKREAQQTLLDHETAIAALERLTGVSL